MDGYVSEARTEHLDELIRAMLDYRTEDTTVLDPTSPMHAAHGCLHDAGPSSWPKSVCST